MSTPTTTPPGDFFGFNPLPTRVALGVGAAVCAVLTMSVGVRPALETGRPSAWGLAAAYGLMTALFLVALYLLRPRAGWGITVGARTLTVSRPLYGPPLEVFLNDLAPPVPSRKESVVLRPKEGRGALVLSRHLFASAAVYHRMLEALEERLPRGTWDA